MVLPLDVFISRDLGVSSVFRGVLEGYGVRVYGQSLVVLTCVALPKEAMVIADWVFFYSGHGVRYFFEQVARKRLPSNVQWGVMGEGTGRVLAEYGYKTAFVGSGEATETAENLSKTLGAGNRVLFVGARHSEHSVERRLSPDIHADYWVVYDNTLASTVVLRSERVLVFTSPLNVRAYLEVHPILPHQQVLAIGNTTGAALHTYGIAHRVASTPSEQALAEGVLKILELG